MSTTNWAVVLLLFFYFDFPLCNCLFPILENTQINCEEIKNSRKCGINEVLSAIVKRDIYIVPYRDGFIGKNRQANVEDCTKYCHRVDECIATSFINKTCSLFSLVTRTKVRKSIRSSFLVCCKDLDIFMRTPANSENCDDVLSVGQKCAAEKTLMWGFFSDRMSKFLSPINRTDAFDSANIIRRKCIYEKENCLAISYSKSTLSNHKFSTRNGLDSIKYDKEHDFYFLTCCPKQAQTRRIVNDEHLATDPIANSCSNIRMQDYAKCQKPEWEKRIGTELNLNGAFGILENVEISICKEQCLIYSMCNNFLFHNTVKRCILRLDVDKNKVFKQEIDFYELACCAVNMPQIINKTTVQPSINMEKYAGYTEAPPHSTFFFFAMVILFTVICIFIVIVSYVLCYCRNHFTEINTRGNSDEEDEDSD